MWSAFWRYGQWGLSVAPPRPAFGSMGDLTEGLLPAVDPGGWGGIERQGSVRSYTEQHRVRQAAEVHSMVGGKPREEGMCGFGPIYLVDHNSRLDFGTGTLARFHRRSAEH